MAISSANLISAWNLNGVATDPVSGYDLVVSGAIYDTGKDGQGLRFDGSNDVAQATGAGFNLSSSDWTVSLWFKVDNLSNVGMIYNWDLLGSTGASGAYIQQVNNLIFFNSGTNTATIPNTTAFHHIVAIQRGSTKELWLNGVMVDSETNTTNPPDTGTVILGKHAERFDQNYDGVLDAVYVWGRAVSTDEIAELYNGGSGTFYPFAAEASDDAMFFGVNF